jgi:hypothetical protein
MLQRVPGVRTTVHYNNNIFGYTYDIEIEDGEKKIHLLSVVHHDDCAAKRTEKPEYIFCLPAHRRRALGGAATASFKFFFYFLFLYTFFSLLRIRRPTFSCNIVPMDSSAWYD